MRIAIASGKGGTGKTTVAVNLLLTLSQRPAVEDRYLFLDCDVEEPNAAIYLNPEIERTRPTGIMLPEVDAEKCTHCGTCAEVCAFHAIAVIGSTTMVFPELCHGCGSCAYNCPENAISEVFHHIGELRYGKGVLPGTDASFDYGEGVLDVGQAMSSPVIHDLKSEAFSHSDYTLAILDAPPGNACPVVQTLRDVDFVILVTEPTPFGLHDVQAAVDIVRDEMNIPFGLVINRDGLGDDGLERFCEQANVPVLARIPFDRRIAEAYAEGTPLVLALPEYKPLFEGLYENALRVYADISEGGNHA